MTGFGNRTAVNGWGPGVDPATNRLIAAEGYQYDANGSVTLMPGVSVDKALEWNALNRLEKVTQGAESEEYEYSPAGQRVFRKRVGGLGAGEGYYFHGARGERMQMVTAAVNGSALEFTFGGRDVRFAGRLICQKGQQVFTDRLGSVVRRLEGSTWETTEYYPYGQRRDGDDPRDQVGFATYDRSERTGLDYAQQRWYGNDEGRFLSGDPYRAPDLMRNPQSWNRYSYVVGDPVNLVDPSGLDSMRVPDLMLFEGNLACYYHVGELGRIHMSCVAMPLALPDRKKRPNEPEIPSDDLLWDKLYEDCVMKRTNDIMDRVGVLEKRASEKFGYDVFQGMVGGSLLGAFTGFVQGVSTGSELVLGWNGAILGATVGAFMSGATIALGAGLLVYQIGLRTELRRALNDLSRVREDCEKEANGILALLSGLR